MHLFYYNMNRYEIANPRYHGNRSYHTIARCSLGLNEIVSQYWTPEALCKFDDILLNHAFDTQNEQMIESVVNKIRLQNEYKERMAVFMDLNGRYKQILADSKLLGTLKLERQALYSELKERRVKLTALYGSKY